MHRDLRDTPYNPSLYGVSITPRGPPRTISAFAARSWQVKRRRRFAHTGRPSTGNMLVVPLFSPTFRA
jgi:hypothetical protein